MPITSFTTTSYCTIPDYSHCLSSSAPGAGILRASNQTAMLRSLRNCSCFRPPPFSTAQRSLSILHRSSGSSPKSVSPLFRTLTKSEPTGLFCTQGKYSAAPGSGVLKQSCVPSSFSRYDNIPRVETGQQQLTLARPVERSGVGLHSGEVAEVRLLPAPAGEGRYFVVGESEEGENFKILASLDYVRDTTLSTRLGKGNVTVRTVEHLLSALEGLGVDNCRIEIRCANEVPLLDGSAMEWVAAIEAAGLSIAKDREGSAVSRRTFVLKEPVSVYQGDSFVAAFPASRTCLSYGIDFSQVPAIGRQWLTWSPDDNRAYQKEVAPARTFAIFEQINQLQAAGLIKGGSLENALVCSMEKGWLNPPLRFPDEPCRHKLLDLIGDLALCAHRGHPGLPVANIVAFKASHALHVKFGEALLRKGLQ